MKLESTVHEAYNNHDEGKKVNGMEKDEKNQAISELTSEMDERVTLYLQTCIRKLAYEDEFRWRIHIIARIGKQNVKDEEEKTLKAMKE